MSPSGTLAIAFQPPTVLNGEVDDAVHLSLLARCTGSLEGTGRGVHPDVDTRDETTSQQEIVVFEEDNLAQELLHLRNLEDALDESLSGTVGGVSLTGKEEDDGALGVVHNLAETVEVGEQQMSALIGCEATAEADDQCVGIETLEELHHT